MRLFYLFIFLLFLNSSFAQKNTSSENIILLKQGALFVRLKTAELQIKALTDKGMKKESEEVKKKQDYKNKAIAEAFKKNYTFSKIYFFYSKYSDEVKNGNYKTYLMNCDLQTDSSFTGGNFLIGEYDESDNTGINAFFIKDKNFNNLKGRFPYMIKLNKALVTNQTDEQIITELNKKLFEFWEKKTSDK